MYQCPNCYALEYITYANGTWEEGYCQNCSYESKQPTTKRDKVPVINIEKPKSQQSKQFKRNK